MHHFEQCDQTTLVVLVKLLVLYGSGWPSQGAHAIHAIDLFVVSCYCAATFSLPTSCVSHINHTLLLDSPYLSQYLSDEALYSAESEFQI